MTESGNIADSAGNRLQVFAVDANGQVTGNAVSDAQVPPTNAAGSEFAGVTITSTGLVQASYADGSVEPIGAVALASFFSPTGLKKVGSATGKALACPVPPATVRPARAPMVRCCRARSSVQMSILPKSWSV